MRYIIARLTEPSSHLGVGQIVAGIILTLSGQHEAGGTLITTGLAGLLVPERGRG
jgi:hypothetical protein